MEVHWADHSPGPDSVIYGLIGDFKQDVSQSEVTQHSQCRNANMRNDLANVKLMLGIYS